ncbi:MAG: hypothetical protein ACO1OC_10915 [Tuberibacillus sp.]
MNKLAYIKPVKAAVLLLAGYTARPTARKEGLSAAAQLSIKVFSALLFIIICAL